ncbi:MAG: IclR family transcriptional regulator [Pseudomonadota bacterium]
MVKSAGRVIQILETVGGTRNGISNAELSAALNIPKGSLSLLLADLVAHEFLSQRKEDRRYVLGPQIVVLAGKFLTDLDIVQLGRPIVHEVMTRTDESSALAVRKGFDILIVYGENSSQPLKRSIEIGFRAPMHITAGGKAILAHLPEDLLEEYFSSAPLAALTPSAITDPEVLKKELGAIKSGGVSYSREEQYKGLIAMAAPVFDLYATVVGAVLVTLPSIRFAPEKERVIAAAILEGAERLSRLMGYDFFSGDTEKGPLGRRGMPGKKPASA